MPEWLVIAIMIAASFLAGWFVASYIWLYRTESNDDRLVEAYISATDAMNDAIENPERSTEILERYFQGIK